MLTKTARCSEDLEGAGGPEGAGWQVLCVARDLVVGVAHAAAGDHEEAGGAVACPCLRLILMVRLLGGCKTCMQLIAQSEGLEALKACCVHVESIPQTAQSCRQAMQLCLRVSP